MKALHNYTISVLFDGPLPGWLLPVVLLAVLLPAWWLYRRENTNTPPRRRAVLTGLRLAVLAFLAFCLFMPRLIVNRVTTYPGRIAVVVDNSLSMQAADSAMADTEALRLGRDLGIIPVADGDAATVFYRIERGLAGLADTLYKTAQTAAGGKPDTGAAARAAMACTLLRKELERPPPEGLDGKQQAAAAVVKEKLAPLLERVAAAYSASAGQRVAFDVLEAECLAHHVVLRELQAACDNLALQSENELAALCVDLRKKTRAELVHYAITHKLTATIPAPARQYLQIYTLDDVEPILVKKPGFAPELPVSRRKTDLGRRLAQISAETTPFPLSGVVLVSDGRDLHRGNYDTILEPYMRRHVAVSAATVGSTAEPYDLAVTQVRGPAIGIVGREHKMEVHVKAVGALPLEASFAVLRDGLEVSAHTATITRQYDVVYLPITPAAAGAQLIEVRIAAAAAVADIFTELNDRSEYAFTARENPVRVLLLDDTPRWQTRFVLNILSRLPYVELNSIIRTVDPEHRLRRGSERGTWPATAEALGEYELIIIGALEKDLLTDQEWAQVRETVEKKGATICFLASPPRSLPAYFSDAAAMLTDDPRAPLAAPAAFVLAAPGRQHPLTGSFSGHVLEQPTFASPTAFVPLLNRHDGGGPLVAWGLAGKGKILTVATERLWQGLNRQLLDAHSELFMRAVEWATRPRTHATFVERGMIGTEEYLQVITDGRPLVVSPPAGAARTLPAGARVSTVPPGVCVRQQLLESGQYRVTDKDGYTETVLVYRDNLETAVLASDGGHLRRIARQTGGMTLTLAELDRLAGRIEPRVQREVVRREYGIWNLHLSLIVIIMLLAVEWIVRKVWNLV